MNAPIVDTDYLADSEVARIKAELWPEPVTPQPTAAALASAEAAAEAAGVDIIAEGDSWFDFPPRLDVLDHLKREYGWRILKFAEAGDTLENMAWGTEIRRNFSRKPLPLNTVLEAVARHRPRFFLLSAGGNDIAGDELASFLNHASSGRPDRFREDYVRHVIDEDFALAIKHICQCVWKMSPDTQVITHGYAHVVPTGRAVFTTPIFGFRFFGPWLRPALARKGIEDVAEGTELMKILIDRFNAMLQRVEADFTKQGRRFLALDLRTVVGPHDFEDELHLGSRGYQQVAAVFNQTMQTLKLTTPVTPTLPGG